MVYNSKVDGNIEDYISNCRAKNMWICFKGHEPFEELHDKEYLLPWITSIRLYRGATPDEYYIVNDDFKLEGVDLPAHSGKEGVHDPKDLLSEEGMEKNCIRYWILDGLDPSKFLFS
jgi:hypothetical protein